MRILASILIFITAVIHILMGGMYIFSSFNEKQPAREKVDDLSLVAGDLVDEDTLKKERQKAEKKIEKKAEGKVGYPGTKELWFGILTLLIAGLEIVCGILLLMRKCKFFVLIGLSVASLCALGLLLAGNFFTISIIALGFLVIAAPMAFKSYSLIKSTG